MSVDGVGTLLASPSDFCEPLQPPRKARLLLVHQISLQLVVAAGQLGVLPDAKQVRPTHPHVPRHLIAPPVGLALLRLHSPLVPKLHTRVQVYQNVALLLALVLAVRFLRVVVGLGVRNGGAKRLKHARRAWHDDPLLPQLAAVLRVFPLLVPPLVARWVAVPPLQQKRAARAVPPQVVRLPLPPLNGLVVPLPLPLVDRPKYKL